MWPLHDVDHIETFRGDETVQCESQSMMQIRCDVGPKL